VTALKVVVTDLILIHIGPFETGLMRWAGHVACMVEMRNAYILLVGKPEGRRHLEDVGVDGRTL
jgi:hypothetical protein